MSKAQIGDIFAVRVSGSRGSWGVELFGSVRRGKRRSLELLPAGVDDRPYKALTRDEARDLRTLVQIGLAYGSPCIVILVDDAWQRLDVSQYHFSGPQPLRHIARRQANRF